ncbi:hypothetical protein IWQ56_005408, partial [Coemansia nantahalensis]
PAGPGRELQQRRPRVQQQQPQQQGALQPVGQAAQAGRPHPLQPLRPVGPLPAALAARRALARRLRLLRSVAHQPIDRDHRHRSGIGAAEPGAAGGRRRTHTAAGQQVAVPRGGLVFAVAAQHGVDHGLGDRRPAAAQRHSRSADQRMVQRHQLPAHLGDAGGRGQGRRAAERAGAADPERDGAGAAQADCPAGRRQEGQGRARQSGANSQRAVAASRARVSGCRARRGGQPEHGRGAAGGRPHQPRRHLGRVDPPDAGRIHREDRGAEQAAPAPPAAAQHAPRAVVRDAAAGTHCRGRRAADAAARQPAVAGAPRPRAGRPAAGRRVKALLRKQRVNGLQRRHSVGCRRHGAPAVRTWPAGARDPPPGRRLGHEAGPN